MKKQISGILLTLAIFAAGGTLMACSTKKAANTTQGATGSAVESTTEKKEEFLYKNAAEYVGSDVMRSALATLQESNAEGMSIDIVAEGEDKVVYLFSYTSLAHTEDDGMTAALESAITAQDGTFQQTANNIQPFIEVNPITVEVRYVDKDGLIIFNRSYVAQ